MLVNVELLEQQNTSLWDHSGVPAPKVCSAKNDLTYELGWNKYDLLRPLGLLELFGQGHQVLCPS